MLSIDTLIRPGGGREIRNLAIGPDGATYLVDGVAGSLSRLVIDPGVSVPREVVILPGGTLNGPVSFDWMADTLVILIASDSSALFIVGSKPVRSLRLSRGFRVAVIDGAQRIAYTSGTGRGFVYNAGKFVTDTAPLVDVQSLHDGRLISSIVQPRVFEGPSAVIGNNIQLARSRNADRTLHVAWPLDAVSQVFGSQLSYERTHQYGVDFSPRAVRHRSSLESFRATQHFDYQQVLFAIEIDSAGAQYVLVAAEKEDSMRASHASLPRQAVDVYDRAGRGICRLPLIVHATSLVLSKPGTLLLWDANPGGGVFRMTFRCDAGSHG